MRRMTGLDVSAPPPQRSRRFALPGSRAGLAWLLALILAGSFLAVQVGRQVYASWSISQQADAVQQELNDLGAQNEALRRELAYLRSDAYISAEARKLLNLGRPGEHVLIIPPGAAVAAPPTAVAEVPAPPPLMEQWLDLFFGG
jgi:cell division protein FtsB